MINIPTKAIEITRYTLRDFVGKNLPIISQSMWDLDTMKHYANPTDYEKGTGKASGFFPERDRMTNGKLFKVGEDGDEVNHTQAIRCGFGVARCEGQDYLFECLLDNLDCRLMAYQALRYKAIDPSFVPMLATEKGRNNTKLHLGAELYFRVLMSLGIVNEIDCEDARNIR